MSEPFPCAECGAMQMAYTVANFRTEDGLMVQRLKHLKCGACGACFFDDTAVLRIQTERAKQSLAHAG